MSLILIFHATFQGQNGSNHQATLTVDPTHPIRQFDPDFALGAGIDGHDFGDIDELFSGSNISRMLSVGFKPITYKLRTELANDAWHWNPQGSWSDNGGQQGYWISDDRSANDISLSYGYSLPRRGNSIDQANDDGFWHRSVDLDQNTEQAGSDRIFKNGIVTDSPVLMPVAMLYDTPENAAAEIRYLVRKDYKFDRVELGEEADGQYMSPEDYGALYIQWRLLHKRLRFRCS